MKYSLRKVNGEDDESVIEFEKVTLTMDALNFGAIVDRINIFGSCKLHLDGKSVELEGFDDTDIMQLNAVVKYKGENTKFDLEIKREDFTRELIRLLTGF